MKKALKKLKKAMNKRKLKKEDLQKGVKTEAEPSERKLVREPVPEDLEEIKEIEEEEPEKK